ncbi:MAG: NADH-quinone oxidoreductase subunit L [Myxococcota bacterium]
MPNALLSGVAASHAELASLAAVAALAIPGAFALGALLVPLGGRRDLFARAERAAAGALLLAGMQILATAASTGASREAAATVLGLPLQLDAVTSVMLGLIAFLALVITRYSRAYVGSEDGGPRYVRFLLATLAAVTTLVVTRNLLVMVLAWTAASLALHQLLTFFPGRPLALVAAHKKFIVSRLADLCLLSAVVLIQTSLGTLDLMELAAITGPLPERVEAATFLLVVGACLRTAQLPFHGWLLQVMEAPTPVSALLHAGVVNLGGFLMIRVGPLMEASPVAQALLVAIAIGTVVVAALAMTTQVSVKSRLAWSTCAQMGFMMLQCGLGAYGLALLHLVAHSLYKAHAFLSSGSTVERWTVSALAPSRSGGSLALWAGAAALGLVTVGLGAAATGVAPTAVPALVPFLAVLGLGLAPIVVRGASAGGSGLLGALALGATVAALYAGLHGVFEVLVPTTPASLELLGPRLGMALVGIVTLFGLQTALVARPTGPLARALRPRLYAGFHLDERFTALTFRLWPAPVPPRRAATLATAEAN